METLQKLLTVQTKLKAPKSQRNNFGGYNYRNCEDILEAVKPLLAEVCATIIVSDELVMVGERYYVKATAKFVDCENKEVIENTGFAREEETKKGMDGSQITGASSSYARKYALNGLLAIDDTKDSDTTNKGDKATAQQIARIRELKVIEKNVCDKFHVDSIEQLSQSEAQTVINIKEKSLENKSWICG